MSGNEKPGAEKSCEADASERRTPSATDLRGDDDDDDDDDDNDNDAAAAAMPDESLSIRLGLVEQHHISSHVLPRFFGFGFEKSFPTSSAASRFFSVPAEDNFFSPDAITNEMLGMRGIACHRLACVASFFRIRLIGTTFDYFSQRADELPL